MTTTDEWKTFEREWAEMIVESVNRIRAAAGVTVKDLASRLAAAGWPVSTATLSGILSGHKRGSISITEWMAFAWALNVQPLYLAVGVPTYGRVPSSPMWAGTTRSVDIVAAWLAGAVGEMPASPGAGISELTRVFGGDAARNLVTHATMLQRTRWQAANIIALGQIPEDHRSEFGLSESKGRDALRSTLRHLASVRAEERAVDASWRLNLEPLPPVLQYLDDLTHKEALSIDVPALTIDQLRTIASSEDVTAAIEAINTGWKAMQMIRGQESDPLT